jgi:hypothetical protein
MRPTRHKPSRIAIGLLERLGTEGSTEFLTGDLIEEHARERSLMWFWIQVVAVVTVCVWQEIRIRKAVAISGAVTGLISLWFFTALVTVGFSRSGLLVHAVNWRWPHYFLLFVAGFAYTAGSSWIVGRLHRAHRVAAVSGFLLSVLILEILELPVLYWLAPSVFFSTIVPHFPFFLIVSIFGAPLSILFGGFYRTSEGTQRTTA